MGKAKKTALKSGRGQKNIASMEVENAPNSTESSKATRYAFACIAIALIAGLGVVMLYSETTSIGFASSSAKLSSQEDLGFKKDSNAGWNNWATQRNSAGKKIDLGMIVLKKKSLRQLLLKELKVGVF